MKMIVGLILFIAQGTHAADFSSHQVKNVWGSLSYYVYPAQSDASKHYDGLILALHGCNQSAMDFSEITRLTTLADKENLVLIFPDQSVAQNSERCWNWFMPDNQSRLTGEPSQFMLAINVTEAHYAVNKSHVYVMGLSAGAIMANVMASCYPEVFAAATLHSGIEYGDPLTPQDANDGSLRCPVLNGTVSGDMAYACSGTSPHKLPKIIIFHGDADTRVHSCNSDSVFAQWVQMKDWADDSFSNGSILQRQSKSQNVSPQGAYSYVQKDLSGSMNWSIRQVTVHGMAHAWSGGAPGCFASDPKGPDATSMSWDFFNSK